MARDKSTVSPEQAFTRARVMFLAAAVAIGVGIAVAGSVDRTAGGVIVLSAWVFAVACLHRLGRAGG